MTSPIVPYVPVNHGPNASAVRKIGAKGEAVFCQEECHRFRLDRDLVTDRSHFMSDPYLKNVNFILLNPSTADQDHDDPTIRRCIGFANEWGYESLTITNLFAIRATDPKVLKQYDFNLTSAHHMNDEAIGLAARDSNHVIVAWGIHGIQDGRGWSVCRLLLNMGIKVEALAVTKWGYPKHPLYLPANLIGEPFTIHPTSGLAQAVAK